MWSDEFYRAVGKEIVVLIVCTALCTLALTFAILYLWGLLRP